MPKELVISDKGKLRLVSNEDGTFLELQVKDFGGFKSTNDVDRLEELIRDPMYHAMADEIFLDLLMIGGKNHIRMGDEPKDETRRNAARIGLSIINRFRLHRGDSSISKLVDDTELIDIPDEEIHKFVRLKEITETES